MSNLVKVDSYIWGKEEILWGYDLSHQYTLKVLNPKLGKDGCLSLQYHNDKSESWVVIKGAAWALVVIDNLVCTRIMHVGDVQNLPAGTIHRIMSVSDQTSILEASTPDKHAADKSVIKDVIRLHCVHGREITQAEGEIQKRIVAKSGEVTLQAIQSIENGVLPLEINPDKFGDLIRINNFK